MKKLVTKWKRLIVVGDLHPNSIWGNARPGFNAGTTVVPTTPLREWLWACWLNFCVYVNQLPITHVFWNGDITDGFNEKTAGIGSWSPNKEDWKNAFYDLRSELIKGSKPTEVILMGTGAHTGIYRGINVEEEIASKLEIPYETKIEMSLDGFWIFCQHQAGGVSLINPESLLQREVNQMSKAVRRGERIKPHVMIYNHVHLYRRWGDGDVEAFINGCWCGITDYQARKSGFVQPSIGGLIIDVEDGELKIHFKRYAMPIDIASTINEEEVKEALRRREIESNGFGATPLHPTLTSYSPKAEKGVMMPPRTKPSTQKKEREVLKPRI
jgi:hypothetical protein